MSFNVLDVPEISPEFVLDMLDTGFAIARQVIPPGIYSSLVNVATEHANKQLDLSERAPKQRFDPTDGARMIALGVHEAFFQAGVFQWEPNDCVFLKNGRLQNPHADMPTYKYGVAIAYFSGELDMQTATREDGLGRQGVIKGILPGDLVLLRALEPRTQFCNSTPDGRTWHNAIGKDVDGTEFRTMLHLGHSL